MNLFSASNNLFLIVSFCRRRPNMFEHGSNKRGQFRMAPKRLGLLELTACCRIGMPSPLSSVLVRGKAQVVLVQGSFVACGQI